jgi:cobalt-zinc-cadmium efflux system outer membrane protein
LPEGDVPLPGLESLAVEQRLDLAAAHAELASVVRALGLTRSYRYVGALQVGADTEREREGDHLTGPKLALELPIFNQGQARIAKREAELRRAERRFEGLAIDIRTEVRELYVRLTAKREAARFYRDEILPDRAAVVQQSLLRYNGMLLGGYELFTVKKEEAEAGRKSVEALRDYWITRAELERAVGGNLRASRPTPVTSKKPLTRKSL